MMGQDADCKVLMLGAGPLQLPAIKVLKNVGCHVVCVDYDPRALGFDIADQAELISTVDEESVLELARRERVDYVLTSTSDAPVRTAAYVSERLGLPTGISYENARCATYKDEMRTRLASCGIPMPDFCVCLSAEDMIRAIESFDYNCVVKPTDGAASRGVKMIDGSLKGLLTAEMFDEFLTFSHRAVLMVEERVSGPEVSVEAMTIAGNTQIIAITDKRITEPPYCVELGHTEPSALPESVRNSIKEVARATINAIGIVDGPSHTEMKITEAGPVVIEIAARLGGDYITSRLVPLSTGINLVEGSVFVALCKTYDFVQTINRVATIGFITSDGGVIHSARGVDEARSVAGVVEVELYRAPGERVASPHSSNDRIGHVICVGDSYDEADKSLRTALSCIDVEVDDVI